MGATELVRRMKHCASAIESLPHPERRERFAVPELLGRLGREAKPFHDA